MRNKLGPWQGKILVMGGRVTLVNSSLTSVPLYMLSFYRIPVGVKEKLDRIRNNFLWDETEEKKKYHLVNGQTVCMPKDQGGLGVLDLEKMNIALLAKWLWKLFNEDGIWQKILRKKYLQKQTLCHAVTKNGDSHFWQGLMEVKKFFWQHCKIQIGDGAKTSF
jgi:hypothetical protein